MAKPVPPELKRLVISARVTPAEKQTLIEVGDGNISRGLDRILIMHGLAPQPAAATPRAQDN